MIESWQCDEKEQYDNVSEEYLYRGAIKTGQDGKYAFTTIVPAPYKDGENWRPAHIHLRISSKDHEDLITQIYFKGDAHIEGDAAANAHESASRILPIAINKSGEKTVLFDIRMGATMKLDDAGNKKISGIYKLKNGSAEFSKKDDMLFLKMNGQYMEGMVFKVNNSFEGARGINRVRFEVLPEGAVKMTLTLWDFGAADQRYFETHEGIKTLQYNE